MTHNPLPNHPETEINAITTENGRRMKTSISKVKALLAWVWSQMVKVRLIAPQSRATRIEGGNHCRYHNKEGHKVLVLAVISRALIASLLVSLLLFQLVEADHQLVNDASKGTSPPKKIDCGGACAARCLLSSRPHLFKRACGTCCARCNCVPPGTAGNQEICSCYASLTTHGRKRKCP
ncbi:snakin-2-like [Hibiscus syriacus]|uniref:snakin-2-like n=1 Tax=Hibiscus syriacus TaxID=106335 RepID=UPI001924A878|nr:snakin-2-like [Hibiscus syriacus]